MPAATKSLATPVGRLVRSEYLVLWLCAAYFLALWPFTPGFATRDNLANLVITMLPLFVVAIGQTLVMVSGGIDLSVTSTMALCSVAGASILTRQQGLGSALAVPLGLLAMLLVGATAGLLNGLAVSRLKMPPFIVTLTSMMFLSGFAIWCTQSKNIGDLPAGFNRIGGTLWVSLPLVAMLGLAAHVGMTRSLAGHWLFATGQNVRAALISGVPVRLVTTGAYVLSGVFAALAAALYTGQAESGSPVLGQRMLLDIIGATVIGGTSLFGGKGKVIWTLVGVLFIKLLDNSLNLLDLSYFSIMMVKGGVILLAAGLDAMRSRTT